jgi:hypothetical protein
MLSGVEPLLSSTPDTAKPGSRGRTYGRRALTPPCWGHRRPPGGIVDGSLIAAANLDSRLRGKVTRLDLPLPTVDWADS